MICRASIHPSRSLCLKAGSLTSRVVEPSALLVMAMCVLLSACSTAPSQQQESQQNQPAQQDQYPDQQDEALTLAPSPRLEPIARNEFFLRFEGQRVVGEPQIIVTRWEDTFADIARAYGLGYDEMVAANPGIDPWLPGAGQAVLLPTQYILPEGPRVGVVLNLAAKRLFYYPPPVAGEPARVLTYPIGVGRAGWNTPLVTTSIVAKATDPSWYVPASVLREHREAGDPLPGVVPPGPDNPLGRHTLRLQITSYLIHGTNRPYGVGMRVSHGCVRLYPENIKQLYGLVNIGEQVRIVNQPYLLAWRDGQLYLQVYRPLDDDQVTPAQRLESLLASAAAQSGAFPDPAAEVRLLAVVAEERGVPVRLLREDVSQVAQRARPVWNVLSTNREAADGLY
jgi:L,D-transpeptidase ErfK/SrfK